MNIGADEREIILGAYGFIDECPKDVRQELIECAQIAQVPAGTVVFEPGGRCPAVAFIGAGSVRVYVASESGREVTLYHVGAGETCPVNLLTAVLDRCPPAKAVIESPVTALMVPAGRFRRWMEVVPSVRRFVLEAVASRFVEVMEQIQAITFGRLDRRLIDFLVQRFESSPEILITHEQIAMELSTAREVVSRLLREMELDGVIDLGRGRVRLIDGRALAERRG